MEYYTFCKTFVDNCDFCDPDEDYNHCSLKVDHGRCEQETCPMIQLFEIRLSWMRNMMRIKGGCPDFIKYMLIGKASLRSKVMNPIDGVDCIEDDGSFEFYNNFGWYFCYNDEKGSIHIVREIDS